MSELAVKTKRSKAKLKRPERIVVGLGDRYGKCRGWILFQLIEETTSTTAANTLNLLGLGSSAWRENFVLVFWTL